MSRFRAMQVGGAALEPAPHNHRGRARRAQGANAALAAAAANPEISPLEFLLGIMRDPKSSSELRIKIAQVMLPFIHTKPGRARPGDPAGTAKLIDGTGAFSVGWTKAWNAPC